MSVVGCCSPSVVGRCWRWVRSLHLAVCVDVGVDVGVDSLLSDSGSWLIHFLLFRGSRVECGPKCVRLLGSCFSMAVGSNVFGQLVSESAFAAGDTVQAAFEFELELPAESGSRVQSPFEPADRDVLSFLGSKL